MSEPEKEASLIEAIAALDRLRAWQSVEAPVTRWEYRRRSSFGFNEMAVLKEMGEEGWELCAAWGLYLYFKRPIRD